MDKKHFDEKSYDEDQDPVIRVDYYDNNRVDEYQICALTSLLSQFGSNIHIDRWQRYKAIRYEVWFDTHYRNFLKEDNYDMDYKKVVSFQATCKFLIVGFQLMIENDNYPGNYAMRCEILDVLEHALDYYDPNFTAWWNAQDKLRLPHVKMLYDYVKQLNLKEQMLAKE